MPKLEYLLVCDTYAIDSETTRLSIFHLLEDRGFPEFPATLPALAVVTSWLLAPGEEDAALPLTLHVTPPGGTLGKGLPMVLRPSDSPRRRSLIHLWNVPFKIPGKWTFSVLLEGQLCGSHTAFIYRVQDDPKVREVD